MERTEFKCLQCGNCCKTKYLCLYPHEIENAFNFAEDFNIELQIEPLRYRIDFKNKTILDLIYQAKKRPCPFFIDDLCSIHKNRFIACRKYPFSNWTRTPKLFVKLMKFPEFFYELDLKCGFINNYYKNIDNQISIDIFNEEYSAFKKDMEIFREIEEKLNYLQFEKEIELKKENIFKKRHRNEYKKILETWKHKAFIGY